MDLRELRTLIALSEQLHFGRAAEAVHVSQPALSKQLRKMEDEVGGPLLLRRGVQTQLTPAGRALADDARRILAEVAHAIHKARRVTQGLEGILNVAFGLATRHVVPRIVARFREQHPSVLVTLRDMSTAAQFAALQSGELDIGFARLPAPAECRSISVISERLVAVVPASMARSQRAHWSSWLAKAPFVELERGRAPHFHDQVSRLRAAKGVHTEVIQIASDFSTVLALVASGVGCSIVPRSALPIDSELISAYALTGNEAKWTVGAVWLSRRPDQALSAFVGCVRSMHQDGTDRQP